MFLFDFITLILFLKSRDQEAVHSVIFSNLLSLSVRGKLSYLAPLGSENISVPYFKQCFFEGGGDITPQTESNTTPPSPKTSLLLCLQTKENEMQIPI